MYKYHIRYIDDHDLLCNIKLYAVSEEDALQKISGLKEVVKLSCLGKTLELPRPIAGLLHTNRLSARELADILRHIAYTKGAGLGLLDSLRVMSTSGTLKQVTLCNKLLVELQNGRSLAEAFHKYEYMLPMQISAIIQASSDAGTLEEVLLSLASQLEKNIAMTNKVRTAMIYPTIVLVLAFAITWFLFVTIIPQIADVLSSLGNGQLPAMTSIVLGIGQFLSNNWIVIVLSGIAAIVIIVFIAKRKAAIVHSRFALTLPAIGTVIRSGELTKFYSHFSFLLSAGFTVADAIKTAAQTVTNRYIQYCIMNAHKRITEGYSLAEAFSMSHVVNPLELQMITIGETSGRLQEVTYTISTQLSNDAERKLQNMLRMMEPLIMVIVGFIVGILMIAIYQPLFEMMTVI